MQTTKTEMPERPQKPSRYYSSGESVDDFNYGLRLNAYILELEAYIEKLEAQAAAPGQPQVGVTSSRSALVDRSAYWIPVGKDTPIGSKCLLIVKADRNALLGQYSRGANWTHYYPLPVFDPNEVR